MLFLRTLGAQFEYVISHRIVPDMSARMEKLSKSDIIDRSVKSVKRPVVGKEHKLRMKEYDV